eukprot:NODE_1402_length_975_cov_125.861771_g1081_i0.p1 GENE.NODE_1402_length_975_cov_125.861771_g1081_i0~~NODE_1402_length_975_cov_125.861771_g1081_i0.p1  ORF type:complete len:109 (+),score=12.15 NODE_1402_length_975_cov_125.861771_g1081_i0:97-423(+)
MTRRHQPQGLGVAALWGYPRAHGVQDQGQGQSIRGWTVGYPRAHAQSTGHVQVRTALATKADGVALATSVTKVGAGAEQPMVGTPFHFPLPPTGYEEPCHEYQSNTTG